MIIVIEQITTPNHQLETVKQLFMAYANELNEDLCFQNFDAELQNPLLKYAPPTGALLVAIYNQQTVGCIALQQIEPNIAEMKRLYVLPQYRKYKIGEALVVALIKVAKSMQYTTLKLDTLQKLQPAIMLYQKLGFTHTNAYYANPLPNVVYMQMEI